MTTFRVLQYLAAHYNWELDVTDSDTHFLQGDLKETIFLEQPQGYVTPELGSQVWRLHRPVYGLKQFPREWHNKLKSSLLPLRFTPFACDLSLFIPPCASGFFLLVYVHAMILAANNGEELNSFETLLQKQIFIKVLGELTHYPGMEVVRDRQARTITLT